MGLTKVANRQWEQIIESWLEQRSGRKPISIASDLQIVRQFCLFRRRYDPAAGRLFARRYWQRSPSV
jgi:hypothetical protein